MKARSILTVLLWAAVFMPVCGEDEKPAIPVDSAELFFVGREAGGGEPEARRFEWRGKEIFVSKMPLLTLRDAETVAFRAQQADDPRQAPRSRSFLGALTLSEWGARRRALAERENKGGRVATVLEGNLSSEQAVYGQRIGRHESLYYTGTLDDLADCDRKLQAALKSFHGQPIKVVREPGEHALAPGWKLAATRTNKGARLELTGPVKADGKPWSAMGELPFEQGAPFIVCWETQWCVLWAASAQGLVAIHFQPDGVADVVTGERENTLRFQDAPASVRREIERVFPPRDGDPAKRVGSIAGTVILAGKPAPGVEVQVFTHFDEDSHEGERFSVKSGEDGRFQIEKVRAPASVQIGIEVMKWRHPNTGQPQATSGPALAFHSHIVKDQKLEFTLGGEGRPVAGRIVDPGNAGRDWSRSQVEFVLVPPCSETVAELRANGHLGYLADAYENFLKSDEGCPYAPGKIQLNAGGSFLVPQLPSAAYWIYVFDEGAPGGRRVRAVEIHLMPGGKSDEVRDLGDIKMVPKDVPPF